MSKKKNTSSLISELKKTRRNYASEEKIRIVIYGMLGESTIAEL